MKTLHLVQLVVEFMVFALCINGSNAWFWRTESSDCTGRDGKPYYFGTTNLWCMTKSKRAPSRSTIALKHRWIFYDGFYFERIRSGDIFDTKARSSDKCSWKREKSPAGYSKLSVECIKKCTEKYEATFGGYNLLTNNCHYFANKISHVLCDYTTCPDWCG